MNLFQDYLRRQWKTIVLLLLFTGIFALVFSLYNLPVEAIGYAALLCSAAGGILFALSYGRYLSRHKKLQRLLQNIEESSFQLPPPAGALEQDYQQLLQAVTAHRNRIAAEGEAAREDMLDYYTLWAHQIKTPIAAMHLLLQQDPNGKQELLQAELFKIEEYVEMVLSYLRLDSETTDYVLHSCDLDPVIRACLRKYARLFVLKKLTLDYSPCCKTAITDEKWLLFTLGQILSNAIKYTPEGGTVRIYGDGENLVISDTGIGIRPEDLPRVFEKGFTGYNGRANQKSSGIGLYLSHRVADRLGIELTLTSCAGNGTLVRLALPAKTDQPEDSF